MTDHKELIAALRNGQQCDEDGVMCIVSRQACHEAADALEVAQAQMQEAVSVEVKPLAWGNAEKSGMNLQADCSFGRYYIALRAEYGWMWWRPANGPAHMGIEQTEDAAKSAAQADYERRILSAIRAGGEQ